MIYTKRKFINLIKSIRFIDLILGIYIVTVFLFTDDTSTLYISNIAFLLLAVAVGFRCISVKRAKLYTGNVKHYFPIVLFSVISIPVAMNASLALSRSMTIISLLALIVLINNCFQELDGNPNVLLLAMLIGGFSVATIIIFEYGMQSVLSGIISGSRLGKDVLQLNYLGRYTYLAALISFYFAYIKKQRLFYILVGLSSLVCLASQSRQAIIALIVTMVLLYLMSGFEKRKLNNILRIALVIAVIVVLLQMPQLEAVRNRLWSGFLSVNSSYNASVSDVKRVYMIKFGLKEFASNPIFGIGLGNVRTVVTGIISDYKYLHNNYVELLATGGLIGFLSYYSIYYIFFKRYRKIMKNTRSDELDFAVVLLIGQLILDMFAVQYYSKFQFLIFAYVFIVILRNEELFNHERLNLGE